MIVDLTTIHSNSCSSYGKLLSVLMRTTIPLFKLNQENSQELENMESLLGTLIYHIESRKSSRIEK